MTQIVATGETLEIATDDLLHLRPWKRAVESPHHHAFSRPDGEGWRAISDREHLTGMAAATRGLIASGIKPGDRVALMSDTRYEWMLLDEAIWNAGAATVPVYPSSSTSQVEWIVSNSVAKLLVVEHQAQADALAGIDVEVLVLDDGALAELTRRGADVPDRDLFARRDGVDTDTLASIVYTSGTTGRPKGVVLTHRHLAAEVAGILEHPIGQQAKPPGRRVLMFLPMAHVLARAVTYAASQAGATVGFWADTSTLVDRLGSFAPHIVLGVPRVFEKLHDGVRASAAESGAPGRALFARGEKAAIAWSRAQGGDGLGDARRPGPVLRAEHALLDRLLFAKVREALGGECLFAISGGGALPAELNHFFRGVGVPVYEGYGLTETCAAITVNGPGCHRIGTVGVTLAGNRVRVADDGEIQLRGAIVMDSYWRDQVATEAAFDDGWYRTGDLGRLDDDGYLSIVGRAKEVLVTAGGKNVAPGPLEDVLRSHPLVANAMVVGEGRRFVGALITLDEAATLDWARQQGRGEVPLAELVDDEALRAEIQRAVDQANETVSRAEGIKVVTLLADDFTEAGEELTATLKLRRHVIERTRAAAIEAIYAG
ncbi:long-chain fatty acid--CoA ligase [Janibacter alkaliphilus]|uniref:Acyl-CoA synthetase n=1 Tax=Janibacter alkaliphilus TaxID=1069963 RepID=A0A852XD83_9MICO|nr:long-chain acyl-CoA synthetase [Janibacter alkaliphilus]